MKCGSWAFHHRLRASQDQAGRRCQNGSPESFVRFTERPSTIIVRGNILFGEGCIETFKKRIDREISTDIFVGGGG